MKRYKHLFTEAYHSATILHIACADVYGLDYLAWDPETLELELLDDLSVSEAELEPGIFDRIHALTVALTTDQYYLYLEAFEKLVRTLNFQDPLFTELSPPDPKEIAAANWEIDLSDSDYHTNKFSGEVVAYTREALRNAGYYRAPRQLDYTKYNAFYSTTWVLEGNKAAQEMDQEQQKRVSEYLAVRKADLQTDLKNLPSSTGSRSTRGLAVPSL